MLYRQSKEADNEERENGLKMEQEMKTRSSGERKQVSLLEAL